MSIVNNVEAELKMESRSDMRAAIITAIIKPRKPEEFNNYIKNIKSRYESIFCFFMKMFSFLGEMGAHSKTSWAIQTLFFEKAKIVFERKAHKALFWGVILPLHFFYVF